MELRGKENYNGLKGHQGFLSFNLLGGHPYPPIVGALQCGTLIHPKIVDFVAGIVDPGFIAVG